MNLLKTLPVIATLIASPAFAAAAEQAAPPSTTSAKPTPQPARPADCPYGTDQMMAGQMPNGHMANGHMANGKAMGPNGQMMGSGASAGPGGMMSGSQPSHCPPTREPSPPAPKKP